MTRVAIPFDDPLLTLLRSLVPEDHRDQFVADAVREKLARLEQRRAVLAAAGSWSSKDRPDPSDFIRDLREGWDRSGRADASDRG